MANNNDEDSRTSTTELVTAAMYGGDLSTETVEDADDGDLDMEDDEEDQAGSGRAPLVRRWLRALSEVLPPESDDNFDFYEAMEEEEAVEDDEEIPCSVGPDHDCFEKRRENLPDLPLENDMLWPQENQRYFDRKRHVEGYVRTDKYPLSVIYGLFSKSARGRADGEHDGKITLPSIMSVYGSS
jgi:hypothetical protein